MYLLAVLQALVVMLFVLLRVADIFGVSILPDGRDMAAAMHQRSATAGVLSTWHFVMSALCHVVFQGWQL